MIKKRRLYYKASHPNVLNITNRVSNFRLRQPYSNKETEYIISYDTRDHIISHEGSGPIISIKIIQTKKQSKIYNKNYK